MSLLLFALGLLLGLFLAKDTRPRHLLQLSYCNSQALWAGKLAAIVVPQYPGLIPKVVLETDKTLVFKHPFPQHKQHLILVPKKDIPNIGEVSAQDSLYIVDLLACLATLLAERKIEDYCLWTNGPGKQDVAYLHFHLGVDT